MDSLAYALINLKEKNKLLPTYRNKCQNSGKTFKCVNTSFRLDACSSFNNIEASGIAELPVAWNSNCMIQGKQQYVDFSNRVNSAHST